MEKYCDHLVTGHLLDTDYKSRYDLHFADWDPSMSFFIDVGSIFASDTETLYRDEEILERLNDICNGNWKWSWDEYRVLDLDPVSNTQQVTDVIRRLWIHFDNKDDAMLSRITLVDLRNARYADGGGMPTGVGASS